MATLNAIERITERIKNQLNASGGAGTYDGQTPDVLTRYIGGQYRQNQPFVTGYHQVLFELPSRLFGENAAHAQKWFTSTCESFTPHSVTINTADVQGIGQIGASFMTSKTIGREFSLGFREYQRHPIATYIDLWHSVFDEHSGASPLAGNEYIPQVYKGVGIVFQLKPTGARQNKITPEDVEEFYIYQGVFPKTNPRDTVGASDQTTNDFIQENVSFSFDGAPLSMSHAYNLLPTLVERLNSLGDYAQTYNGAIMNAQRTVGESNS